MAAGDVLIAAKDAGAAATAPAEGQAGASGDVTGTGSWSAPGRRAGASGCCRGLGPLRN